MSRGLVPLVWRPEDGTRGFSPPASSAAFPRRSREDRQTQRASATCSTWDGPGWRKCNHEEAMTVTHDSVDKRCSINLQYHLHSCCTHPEYPSQSSPEPCGTRSVGRGEQLLKWITITKIIHKCTLWPIDLISDGWQERREARWCSGLVVNTGADH